MGRSRKYSKSSERGRYNIKSSIDGERAQQSGASRVKPLSTNSDSRPHHHSGWTTMSTKFSPTPAELALVSQIFLQADPQKHGILTGDVAVKVFGGANLKPTVLGEIWSIADEDNNGFLPRKGVAIAIRLMGWAQKGEKITPVLVNKRE